jgi:predicted small secreted protein
MRNKIFLALFILGVSSFGLVACNTVQGFGDDLQTGGSSLSKAAQKAKN